MIWGGMMLDAPHVPLQTWMFNEWYGWIKDKNRRDYAAMVTHMDFQIGRIVRILREKNLYDDTVIWFLSDNGGWEGLGGQNKPYKGGKLTFYEGGLKAVSFLSHKSLRDIGNFNNLCHMVDVFPTICNLAKINIPYIDGKSVFENITDRDFVNFLAKNDTQLVGSIRSGDWKLNKLSDIRLLKNGYDEWYLESARLEGSELFNIKEDPFEKQNLISNNPEIVHNLLNKLIDYSKDYVSPIKFINPARTNEECCGDINPEILMLEEEKIDRFNNLDLYSMSLEKITGYYDESV